MLTAFFPALATVVALSLWFWRSRQRDASLWMYLTYAGAGWVLWEQYWTASSLANGLPLVVRDFLLIGIVGLVQSLAVAKRISIGVAVLLIFGLFVVAYSLPFGPGASRANHIDNTAQEMEAAAMVADPDGEYLVELGADRSLEELSNWAQQQGYGLRPAFQMAEEEATDLDNFYVLDVVQADAATEELLQQQPFIHYFEINEQVQLSPQPVQPLKTNKGTYGVNDPAANQQWVMEALNMPAYYDLLRGLQPKKVAKIAILDTGVDAQHEDIKGNYFSTKQTYDDDPQGHGTHCAGIAAAVTNNGIGIASLAGPGQWVRVTGIKVLSSGGMGTQKTIIQGILEAADSGVDVISMSLGGASNPSRQRAYNQAVSYANRQGAIVVAAAGNSNREATNFAPAGAAGVICVAAIDNLQLRAPFSNRIGGIRMGIAAPGVAIYSTLPNNKYAAYSGTSMACPFVAGLIGVMRSIAPELTTAQAYALLNDTAKRTTEVDQLGGIVQPAAALAKLVK